MPLGEAPSRAVLRRLPSWQLAGRTLHRVHRADRNMWWFANVDPAAPQHCGRFDLPLPSGACYTATAAATAALEAFQHDFAGGILPSTALDVRRVSSVTAPQSTPRAALLTAQRALGAGVTSALWSAGDRPLTQRWAAELHGSGWQAIVHGVQHDPSGRRRAITLFDRAGAHEPWSDGDWPTPVQQRANSPAILSMLDRHGIRVTTRRPSFQVTDDI